MPAILGWILGAISSLFVNFFWWAIKKIFALIGVVTIANVGVEPFIEKIVRGMNQLLTGDDPYQIYTWMAVFRMQESVSVVLSAVIFAILYRFSTNSMRVSGG